MDSDKIKILKFVNGSNTAVNNHHIIEHFTSMSNPAKCAEELVRDGYIEKHPTLFGYRLTASGRKVLECFNRDQRKTRIENIKYVVTTVIAVAAFVKSFFF